MANSTLITDWSLKDPGIPFTEDNVDKIVIVTPWTAADFPEPPWAAAAPELTSGQIDEILTTAALEFLKFYHPTRWHSLVHRDHFLATNSDMGYGTGVETDHQLLPTGFALPGSDPAETTTVTVGVHDAAWANVVNDDIFDLLTETLLPSRPTPNIVILDRKMPPRPGSRLRVLCAVDREKFNVKTSLEPVSGLASSLSAAQAVRDESKGDFSGALQRWNEVQNFGPPEHIVSLSWKALEKQISTVEKLFTKYQTQNQYFDGQISPVINFDNDFEAISAVFSNIRKLLKLNNYKTPSKEEDDVYIFIDSNYNIVGIDFLQPRESINQQKVQVGYFSYTEGNFNSLPFNNSQAIVYLSRWQQLVDLAEKPSKSVYKVFDNFIRTYASSKIQTYEIDYCGPSHSPTARAETSSGLTGPIAPPIPTPFGFILDEGVVDPGDNVLSVKFADVELQNKLMSDAENRQLILTDQLDRLEAKTKEPVEFLMKKLKELENSEEMAIIKDVLNKVGIDVLIKEVINCLVFNANFDANNLISDVKELLSTGARLFSGRRPPMEITYPDLEIDLPIFDITGGMDEMIKKMLLDLLMEVIAALVQGIAELIKEMCQPDDLAGGEHGALNLAGMFDAEPADREAGTLLDEPAGGPSTCFSSYKISETVGMEYMTAISAILRPAEICQLLKGTPTDDVVNAVLSFNETYSAPAVPENLNTAMAVINFFVCLGDLVDVDAICQQLIEENIIPNIEDLCLTEDQVLSSIDEFNLHNLLDMLENGVEFDVPEVNISCPSRPGYIPNPLVERSIPQLLSTLAETIAVNFYIAVDGIKQVLLIPSPNGNADAQSLLCGAPWGVDFQGPDEGGPEIDGKIMKDIATAFRNLSSYFQAGMTPFTEAVAGCDMNPNEIFRGWDDIQNLLPQLAEIFENLDFSAAAQFAGDLDTMSGSIAQGILPVASYTFPEEFRDSIDSLTPWLGEEEKYREWPRFWTTETYNSVVLHYKVQLPPHSSTSSPNDRPGALGSGKTGNDQGFEVGHQSTLLYSFGAQTATQAEAGVINNERLFIKYPSMYNVLGTGGSITSVDVAGPTIFGGSQSFISEIYVPEELEVKLHQGHDSPYLAGLAVREGVESDPDNPALTAFATMVVGSIKQFIEDFGDDLDEVVHTGFLSPLANSSVTQESWLGDRLEDFYTTLKKQYHHSAQMGLQRGFALYATQRGIFNTNGIMSLLLKKNNSNCGPNDADSVGDLMDIRGIVKDVQDEYNESICNDDMSLEDTLEKCILLGAMLLFLQVTVVQFYLKNINVLASFKLSDIWGLSVVRDFVLNTVYRTLDEFMTVSRSTANLENFSSLFINEANDWMSRKIARPDGTLDVELLSSLNIVNKEELLEGNNALKYMLMWRMKRSSKPIQNIISNPNAESIEDVFIKRVIGFEDPFTVPFHLDSVVATPGTVTTSITGAETVDIPVFGLTADVKKHPKLYVDASRGISELFGYGGFKLEPFVTWDSTSFGPDVNGDVLRFPVGYKQDAKLFSYLTFKRGQPGQASASKLYAGLFDREGSQGEQRGLGGPGEVAGQVWDSQAQTFVNVTQEFPGDVSLLHVKIKYRLVYYPPFENSDHSTDDDPKYSWIAKIYRGAISPALQSTAAAVLSLGIDDIGELSETAQAALGFDDTDELNQYLAGILKGPSTILSEKEAFVQIGVANHVDGYTDPILQNLMAYPHNENTFVKEGREWRSVWPNWCQSLDDTQGGDVSADFASCVEPPKTGASLQECVPPDENGEGGNMGTLWAWQREISDRCNSAGNSDPGCCDTRWGAHPGQGGCSDQPVACAGESIDCGEWTQVPRCYEITEGGTVHADQLVPNTELSTIGIPIMEFGTELSTGAIQYHPASKGLLADLIPGNPNNTQGSAHRHMKALKGGPDYDKFNYFFSKVFDRDLALTTLLMHNFYLTETRFSFGIKDLFSDTVRGAANLFLIALDTPSGSGTREDRMVGIPGIQEPSGQGPQIDIRGPILKALREMPLIIFKGLCEMLDPHVMIMKLIKDISGLVINGMIDGMDTGLAVAGEADPTGVLKAVGVDAEGLVEFAFCELNNKMTEKAEELWDDVKGDDECVSVGLSSPGFPDGLFPKFTTKGIQFTGTLPGLFMCPPGPFGIIYLLLSLINLDLGEGVLDEEDEELNSC